jgi:hypothetical protein
MTANDKGQKFFDAHKKWISQAKELAPKVTEFNTDFIKSLDKQIDGGIPLTARQFISLKKTVFFLKHKSEGK